MHSRIKLSPLKRKNGSKNILLPSLNFLVYENFKIKFLNTNKPILAIKASSFKATLDKNIYYIKLKNFIIQPHSVDKIKVFSKTFKKKLINIFFCKNSKKVSQADK